MMMMNHSFHALLVVMMMMIMITQNWMDCAHLPAVVNFPWSVETLPKSIQLASTQISNYQEPITWSEKLPCTLVTAFSWTSLFLERFWREF